MSSIHARPLAAVLALGVLAAACQPAAGPEAPDYAAVQQPAADAFLDAWNNGNLDGLDAVMSADVQRRSPRGVSDADNLEELKAVVSALRTEYPDAMVTVTEVHHLENLAFAFWTFAGTHAETGKSVSVPGLTALRYMNGQITEELAYYDTADWMMQLGYTMAEPASEVPPVE